MGINGLKGTLSRSNKGLLILIPILMMFLLWYAQISFIKLGIVFAMLLFILVITNEFLAIVFFVTLSFTLSYTMSIMNLPGKMEYITDFTILVIFMYAIITGRKKLYTIDIILLLNILFILISASIGNNAFMVKVKGLSFYLRYPLFAFALMRLRISDKQFKSLISYIMILAFLQIPTSIVQRLMGFIPDNAGGFLAFYGSTICAVLMNIVFIIMLASMMVYGVRRKYVFLSLLLLIPLILSSARAGFIYFAFSAIFMFFIYMTYIRYSSQHSGIITVVGIIIMLALIYVSLVYVLPIFEPQNANAMTLLTSGENMRNYVLGSEATGKLKRIETLIFGYNYLKMDFVNLLIGAGPGSTVQSESFGSGIFASYYGQIFYSRLSMAAFLVDTGLLGIFLHIMIYFYFMFYAFTNAIYIKDKFFRVIGYALPGISILMITSSVYTSVWNQEALQTVFWILAVSVFVAGHETRKQRIDNLIIYDDDYFSRDRTPKSSMLDWDFFDRIEEIRENDIKRITIVVPGTDNALIWLQFNRQALKKQRIRVVIPGRRENYSTYNALLAQMDRSSGTTVLINKMMTIKAENIDSIYEMDTDMMMDNPGGVEGGLIIKMSNPGIIHLRKSAMRLELQSLDEIAENVKSNDIDSIVHISGNAIKRSEYV